MACDGIIHGFHFRCMKRLLKTLISNVELLKKLTAGSRWASRAILSPSEAFSLLER